MRKQTSEDAIEKLYFLPFPINKPLKKEAPLYIPSKTLPARDFLSKSGNQTDFQT